MTIKILTELDQDFITQIYGSEPGYKVIANHFFELSNDEFVALREFENSAMGTSGLLTIPAYDCDQDDFAPHYLRAINELFKMALFNGNPQSEKDIRAVALAKRYNQFPTTVVLKNVDKPANSSFIFVVQLNRKTRIFEYLPNGKITTFDLDHITEMPVIEEAFRLFDPETRTLLNPPDCFRILNSHQRRKKMMEIQ